MEASGDKYAAHSNEKMKELAQEIVSKLGELCELEKSVEDSGESRKAAKCRLEECQGEIIPLLESAILFSPNDQTMRIVYNAVYCETKAYDLMRASLVRLSIAFGQGKVKGS